MLRATVHHLSILYELYVAEAIALRSRGGLRHCLEGLKETMLSSQSIAFGSGDPSFAARRFSATLSLGLCSLRGLELRWAAVGGAGDAGAQQRQRFSVPGIHGEFQALELGRPKGRPKLKESFKVF